MSEHAEPFRVVRRLAHTAPTVARSGPAEELRDRAGEVCGISACQSCLPEPRGPALGWNEHLAREDLMRNGAMTSKSQLRQTRKSSDQIGRLFVRCSKAAKIQSDPGGSRLTQRLDQSRISPKPRAEGIFDNHVGAGPSRSMHHSCSKVGQPLAQPHSRRLEFPSPTIASKAALRLIGD